MALDIAIAVASLHGRLIDRPGNSRPDHRIGIQNQCATNAGDGNIKYGRLIGRLMRIAQRLIGDDVEDGKKFLSQGSAMTTL